MAYQRARGQGQRIRFVSRERAYHGVNIGGVSLSGLIKNREAFPATMPHVALMRHTWLEEKLQMLNDEDLEALIHGFTTLRAVFEKENCSPDMEHHHKNTKAERNIN